MFVMKGLGPGWSQLTCFWVIVVDNISSHRQTEFAILFWEILPPSSKSIHKAVHMRC